jgi:hypothetical protein
MSFGSITGGPYYVVVLQGARSGLVLVQVIILAYMRTSRVHTFALQHRETSTRSLSSVYPWLSIGSRNCIDARFRHPAQQ